MPSFFHVQKKTPTASRRLPFLPRFGIYVDIGGYEAVYKHAPLAETIIELINKGWSTNQLRSVVKKQLAEIKFPKIQKSKVIETTFRHI